MDKESVNEFATTLAELKSALTKAHKLRQLSHRIFNQAPGDSAEEQAAIGLMHFTRGFCPRAEVLLQDLSVGDVAVHECRMDYDTI